MLDVAGHRPDDEVGVGRGDDVQVARDGLDGDPAADRVEGHLARGRPVALVAEEAVRLDLGARGLDDDRRSMGQVDLDVRVVTAATVPVVAGREVGAAVAEVDREGRRGPGRRARGRARCRRRRHAAGSRLAEPRA